MTIVSLSKRFAPAAASTLMLAGCVTPDFGYPTPILGSGEPRAEVRVEPVQIDRTTEFIQAAYKHHTAELILQRDIVVGNFFKREVDQIVCGVYNILSEDGLCLVEDPSLPQCFENGFGFEYSSLLFEDNMRIEFTDVTDTCVAYSATFQSSTAFSMFHSFNPLAHRQICETKTSSFTGDYDSTKSLRPSQQGSNQPRP